MKIDKAIWASSVEYSDFWNVNSYLHNKYLGNDKKRESIAVAGYELVKEKHTYKHRAHRILEMIK